MPERQPLLADLESGPEAIALLRRNIDEINIELLRLLERRGALALNIMRLKNSSGLALHDRAREAAMIAELATHSRGLYDEGEIAAVFHAIFEASRALAARMFAGRNYGPAA